MSFSHLRALLFTVILFSFGSCAEGDGGVEKLIEIVKQWSPKIWIDEAERFYPGSVEDFLKGVTPTKNGCTKNCKVSKIPTGAESKNYHLVTNNNKEDLLKDHSSFLYGTNPAKSTVPAYAHITSCDSGYNHFIVGYWFFYPFNYGKDMCAVEKHIPMIKVLNKCLGSYQTFGNHIGDWEHVSLEIKNGAPTRLFLSVHDIGIYYNYDKSGNSFVYTSATTHGLQKVKVPPHTVKVEQGHPILYAANGSHAVWGSSGNYEFTRIPTKELSDTVGMGTAWETWKDIKVFYSNETTPDWYNYEGRWGNPQSDCIGGKGCLWSDGPEGLSIRPADLKCK